MEQLSDEATNSENRRIQERVAKGETFDDIQPEAFAVVREGATPCTWYVSIPCAIHGGCCSS